MTRKSYVMVNGQLWEKAGHNHAIINGENWYCIGGVWEPTSAPSASRAAYIIPDIQPYQSTIDGSMIKSRSHHREHLRQHNCIEIGNDRPSPPKQEITALRGLREELSARIYG